MATLNTNIDVLERMILIRRFEEGMLLLREQGIMPVHFHISIGQEVTAVSVCSAARDGDMLYTNHRSNGHLIARGADPEWMYAEQLGRVDGNTNGKGGTLHMIAPELGMPWTTSLVGCSIPMAVGSALIMKSNKQAIVIAFIGDGVMQEGAFYEGVNLAALWKVPLLCICENNGVSPEVRGSDLSDSSVFCAEHLSDIPSSFGFKCRTIDGSDVENVFLQIKDSAEAVRSTREPHFVEVRTSRYPGNRGFWPRLAGSATDLSWAWRGTEPPDILSDWTKGSDPLMRFIEKLLADEEVTREQVLQIDREVRTRIEKAMAFAIDSPQPSLEEAYRNVWADEEER